MNNKGFTLIELIMVISVLAMLALLSTPNVIKLIDKNKTDNYNNTVDSIIRATELYVSANRYNLTFIDSDEDGKEDFCLPTDNNDKNITSTVTLQELINRKDITSPVKNFCTDEEISNDTLIKIILNCGTRQFNYDIEENSTLKRRTDTNGTINGIEGLKITKCSDLY